MVVSLNPHPTPLFLLRIDLRVSLGTLMETVLVDRLAVVVSSLPCIASSQDPPQADGLFLISQRIPTLPAPPPHSTFRSWGLLMGENMLYLSFRARLIPCDVTFPVPPTFLQVSYFSLSLWHP